MNNSEIVVYYKGEKPETIYRVYDMEGVTYTEIEGYWLPVDDGTDTPKYNFVPNENKRPYKWDKDWLMNKIIPDAKATKCFDTLDDFNKDNFLESI